MSGRDLLHSRPVLKRNGPSQQEAPASMIAARLGPDSVPAQEGSKKPVRAASARPPPRPPAAGVVKQRAASGGDEPSESPLAQAAHGPRNGGPTFLSAGAAPASFGDSPSPRRAAMLPEALPAPPPFHSPFRLSAGIRAIEESFANARSSLANTVARRAAQENGDLDEITEFGSSPSRASPPAKSAHNDPFGLLATYGDKMSQPLPAEESEEDDGAGEEQDGARAAVDKSFQDEGAPADDEDQEDGAGGGDDGEGDGAGGDDGDWETDEGGRQGDDASEDDEFKDDASTVDKGQHGDEIGDSNGEKDDEAASDKDSQADEALAVDALVGDYEGGAGHDADANGVAHYKDDSGATDCGHDDGTVDNGGGQDCDDSGYQVDDIDNDGPAKPDGTVDFDDEDPFKAASGRTSPASITDGAATLSGNTSSQRGRRTKEKTELLQDIFQQIDILFQSAADSSAIPISRLISEYCGSTRYSTKNAWPPFRRFYKAQKDKVGKEDEAPEKRYVDMFQGFTMSDTDAWKKFQQEEPNFLSVLNAFSIVRQHERGATIGDRTKDFAKYMTTVRDLIDTRVEQSDFHGLFIAFGLNVTGEGSFIDFHHTDAMEGALKAKTGLDGQDLAEQLRAYALNRIADQHLADLRAREKLSPLRATPTPAPSTSALVPAQQKKRGQTNYSPHKSGEKVVYNFGIGIDDSPHTCAAKAIQLILKRAGISPGCGPDEVPMMKLINALKTHRIAVTGWPYFMKFPTELSGLTSTGAAQGKGFGAYGKNLPKAFAVYLKSKNCKLTAGPVTEMAGGAFVIMTSLPSPDGTTFRKLWSDKDKPEEVQIKGSKATEALSPADSERPAAPSKGKGKAKVTFDCVEDEEQSSNGEAESPATGDAASDAARATSVESEDVKMGDDSGEESSAKPARKKRTARKTRAKEKPQVAETRNRYNKRIASEAAAAEAAKQARRAEKKAAAAAAAAITEKAEKVAESRAAETDDEPITHKRKRMDEDDGAAGDASAAGGVQTPSNASVVEVLLPRYSSPLTSLHSSPIRPPKRAKSALAKSVVDSSDGGSSAEEELPVAAAAGPAKSAAAAQPAKPAAAAKPSKPAAAAQPAKPAAAAQPTKPAATAKPATAAPLVKPRAAAQPVKPTTAAPLAKPAATPPAKPAAAPPAKPAAIAPPKQPMTDQPSPQPGLVQPAKQPAKQPMKQPSKQPAAAKPTKEVTPVPSMQQQPVAAQSARQTSAPKPTQKHVNPNATSHSTKPTAKEQERPAAAKEPTPVVGQPSASTSKLRQLPVGEGHRFAIPRRLYRVYHKLEEALVAMDFNCAEAEDERLVQSVRDAYLSDEEVPAQILKFAPTRSEQ